MNGANPSGRRVACWVSFLNPAYNAEWMNARRRKRNQSTLWRHRFWEHLIRDEADFNRHIGYIHWNPVKHGYVAEVSHWPYSSFHRYVKHGWLPRDWGSNIESLNGADFGE